MKLVQVNFDYHPESTADAQKAAVERAHAIAQVSGLHWKIWTYHNDSHQAGGIYLFDDEASANAYLQGPIFSSLTALPSVSHMQVKVLDINLETSQITRAPLPGI